MLEPRLARRTNEGLIERFGAPCPLCAQFAYRAGSDRRCCVDANNIVGRSIRKHDDPKACWPREEGVGICHGGMMNRFPGDAWLGTMCETRAGMGRSLEMRGLTMTR